MNGFTIGHWRPLLAVWAILLLGLAGCSEKKSTDNPGSTTKCKTGDKGCKTNSDGGADDDDVTDDDDATDDDEASDDDDGGGTFDLCAAVKAKITGDLANTICHSLRKTEKFTYNSIVGVTFVPPPSSQFLVHLEIDIDLHGAFLRLKRADRPLRSLRQDLPHFRCVLP